MSVWPVVCIRGVFVCLACKKAEAFPSHCRYFINHRDLIFEVYDGNASVTENVLRLLNGSGDDLLQSCEAKNGSSRYLGGSCASTASALLQNEPKTLGNDNVTNNHARQSLFTPFST